ncbi:hypothetical protein VNO77_44116 [Canavalia gladiata]|uniref:Uncharacterized protein n=1 Tax=Canavalia gladiata TaxID=3824 RepID=A0AAN9JVG0_CANGL
MVSTVAWFSCLEFGEVIHFFICSGTDWITVLFEFRTYQSEREGRQDDCSFCYRSRITITFSPWLEHHFSFYGFALSGGPLVTDGQKYESGWGWGLVIEISEKGGKENITKTEVRS